MNLNSFTFRCFSLESAPPPNQLIHISESLTIRVKLCSQFFLLYLCSCATDGDFPSYFNMIIFWCNKQVLWRNIYIKDNTRSERFLKTKKKCSNVQTLIMSTLTFIAELFTMQAKVVSMWCLEAMKSTSLFALPVPLSCSTLQSHELCI